MTSAEASLSGKEERQRASRVLAPDFFQARPVRSRTQPFAPTPRWAAHTQEEQVQEYDRLRQTTGTQVSLGSFLRLPEALLSPRERLSFKLPLSFLALCFLPEQKDFRVVKEQPTRSCLHRAGPERALGNAWWPLVFNSSPTGNEMKIAREDRVPNTGEGIYLHRQTYWRLLNCFTKIAFFLKKKRIFKILKNLKLLSCKAWPVFF